MSPKRGDRVAPPPGPDDYDVRFDDSAACNGWDELCRKAAGKTRWAYEEMRTNPGPKPPTSRHHQLKGSLATAKRNGEELPQWQIEVTGGGRVWYLLDTARKTCWVRLAEPGHPKQTDR